MSSTRAGCLEKNFSHHEPDNRARRSDVGPAGLFWVAKQQTDRFGKPLSHPLVGSNVCFVRFGGADIASLELISLVGANLLNRKGELAVIFSELNR